MLTLGGNDGSFG